MSHPNIRTMSIFAGACWLSLAACQSDLSRTTGGLNRNQTADQNQDGTVTDEGQTEPGGGGSGLDPQCEALLQAVQDCYDAAFQSCGGDGTMRSDDSMAPPADPSCFEQCAQLEQDFYNNCQPPVPVDPCEEARILVEQCFQDASLMCPDGDPACFEQCNQLKIDLSYNCMPPPPPVDDPCNLLFLALDSCYMQGFCEERCYAIQDTINVVCDPSFCHGCDGGGVRPDANGDGQSEDGWPGEDESGEGESTDPNAGEDDTVSSGERGE